MFVLRHFHDALVTCVYKLTSIFLIVDRQIFHYLIHFIWIIIKIFGFHIVQPFITKNQKDGSLNRERFKEYTLDSKAMPRSQNSQCLRNGKISS